MKVLSVSTTKNAGCANFCTSLQRAKIPYELLGVGEKWGGWRYRMQTYVNTLTTLPQDEIVLLSDADDMLCLRGTATELEEAFLAFDKPIVVAAELTCNPMYNCVPVVNYWGDTPPPVFQYVNAGVVVGRANALAEMWQWILDQGYDDDQRGLGAYVNAHPSNVVLDSDCKIFYVNPPPQSGKQGKLNWDEDENFVSVDTGVLSHMPRPFFVHFAGNFVVGAIDSYFLGKPLKSHQPIYNTVSRKLLGKDAIEVSNHTTADTKIGVAIFWTTFALLIVALLYIIGMHVRRRKADKSKKPSKPSKTEKT